MSLYKNLYDGFKAVQNSRLVQSKGPVTDEDLEEFENLLNDAQPQNETERNYQQFFKGMYHSNPLGCIKYIYTGKNNVSACILWTESKRIIRYFNLQGRVHLSWNKETSKYVVSRYNVSMVNKRETPILPPPPPVPVNKKNNTKKSWADDNSDN